MNSKVNPLMAAIRLSVAARRISGVEDHPPPLYDVHSAFPNRNVHAMGGLGSGLTTQKNMTVAADNRWRRGRSSPGIVFRSGWRSGASFPYEASEEVLDPVTAAV